MNEIDYDLTQPELELLIELVEAHMDKSDSVTQREWAFCKALSEKLDVMLDEVP